MLQRLGLSFYCLGVSLLLGLVFPLCVSAQYSIRHALRVVVQPDQHVLQVTDSITLPETFPPAYAEPWHFALHAGLSPVPLTPGVQLVRQPAVALDTAGHNHESAVGLHLHPPLERYALMLPAGTRTFVLQYQGTISQAVPPQGTKDAWSMPDTAGMLAAEGVYLSAATYWYPRFADEMVTFTLDVQCPLTWEVISQGARTRHERANDVTYVRWEAPTVQEEVYLVGGPLS